MNLYNTDHELKLLSALVYDPLMFDEISVSPADFYDARNVHIFKAIQWALQHDKKPDLPLLSDLCKKIEPGYWAKIEPMTAANIQFYVDSIHRLAQLRKLDHLSKQVGDLVASGKEPGEIVETLEVELTNLSTSGGKQIESLKDLLNDVIAQVEDCYKNRGKLPGIPTGFRQLDHLTGGLQKGEFIVIGARPSIGKAQPLDSLVKTFTGWKCMGELHVGDRLASIDGGKSYIKGVFPQGKKPVYRITFSDGRSTECCEDHLWRIYYRDWETLRVLSLNQLSNLLKNKRYKKRLWIDVVSGDFGHRRKLPIDPWVLGVLIGDGNLLTVPRFSTGDGDILQKLQEKLPDFEIKHVGNYDYRIITRNGWHRQGVCGSVPNLLKNALSDLGLWGKLGHEKFVPSIYKLACKSARLELLRGLIDTDGWVSSWGSVVFSTTSLRLCHDVVELVRSLGGICSIRERRTRYTHNGEKRIGRISFRIGIQHPQLSNFVSLRRKQERISMKKRQSRLTIRKIEFSRFVDTQCIAVTHPSQLYITNDYIATHNTAFALCMARAAAGAEFPVGFFSLEQSQSPHRLLAAESLINLVNMRTGYLRDGDFSRLVDGCNKLANLSIYFDHYSYKLSDIRSQARRLVRMGVKIIFIDYLTLIHFGDSSMRTFERVGEISHSLKWMARELDIPVVVLSQLNREAEGKRPTLAELRMSGEIEQDADMVIFLHRARKAETFETIVDIAKQRNGPVEEFRVMFEPHFTRFTDMGVV